MKQPKVNTTEEHTRKLATMSTAQILKSQPQLKKVHEKDEAEKKPSPESNGKKSEVHIQNE